MKNFLVAALGAASVASAQIARNCPMGDSLCYSVHVPESAASSGQGDLYFQIRAPSTYGWAALGQGTMMAGAHIFVIYANSAGNNVTLSPRLGQGHFEPSYDPDTRAELLAGSGIEGGMMVANVLCTNCASWGGGSGSMQLNDPSSNWIWAYNDDESLSSNSAAASIDQHKDHGTITFDLRSAAGGADNANPFTQAGANTTSSTSSSSSSSGGGGSSSSMILMAHAICMGLAMVILYPLGAMTRRLLSRTTIWLHAAVQLIALCLTIAGVGLGIQEALSKDYLMRPHPIIGLVVFALLVLQPVTGLLQHSHFRAHGARSAFGWGHKTLGFAAVILGIINGGLGLQLANNTTSGVVAYAVVAAIMSLIWFAVTAWGCWRNRRGPAQAPAKERESASHSPQYSGSAGYEQPQHMRNGY